MDAHLVSEPVLEGHGDALVLARSAIVRPRSARAVCTGADAFAVKTSPLPRETCAKRSKGPTPPRKGREAQGAARLCFVGESRAWGRPAAQLELCRRLNCSSAEIAAPQFLFWWEPRLLCAALGRQTTRAIANAT
jgi:hypothetical protein